MHMCQTPHPRHLKGKNYLNVINSFYHILYPLKFYLHFKPALDYTQICALSENFYLMKFEI